MKLFSLLKKLSRSYRTDPRIISLANFKIVGEHFPIELWKEQPSFAIYLRDRFNKVNTGV